jgi:hypothetical protein
MHLGNSAYLICSNSALLISVMVLSCKPLQPDCVAKMMSPIQEAPMHGQAILLPDSQYFEAALPSSLLRGL